MNKTMTEECVHNELTTKEKKYWFKCVHKTIQTNARKAHWLTDTNGKKHNNTCPVCKTRKETWEHYEYECTAMQMYIKRMDEVYEYYMSKTDQGKKTWTKPTREEWRLDMDTRDMPMEEMVIIAKARYVYEKMRVRLDYGQRRTMTIDHLIDELKETLEPTITRETQRNKERAEGKGKKRKRTGKEKTDRDDQCTCKRFGRANCRLPSHMQAWSQRQWQLEEKSYAEELRRRAAAAAHGT